jgi:hypothetical protein
VGSQNAVRVAAASIAVLLAVSGCSSGTEVDGAGGTTSGAPTSTTTAPSTSTTTAPAPTGPGAPLVEWMDLTFDTVKRQALSPPVASRAYALVAVTAHETLRPQTGAASLAGTLNGLASLPAPPPEIDALAALPAAVAIIGHELFPAQPSVDAFDALAAAQLDALGDGAALESSTAWGRELGEAIVVWSRTDGYVEAGVGRDDWVADDLPGAWEPTPPRFENPLEPYWGTIRPMVAATTAECEIRPPFPFSEDPTSDFYAEAMRTKEAVDEATEDEVATAWFWDDSLGRSGTPPGHWVALVGQLAQEHEMSLGDTATAYLLATVASNEAFIGAWDAKYETQVLRPVTYIQRYIDPEWMPILITPNFPEYPSGHSVQSGAASTVLEAFLGEVAFTDNTVERVDVSRSQNPHVPRAFASIREAAVEASWSRIYGGIHYVMGKEAGFELGDCIGAELVEALGVELREGAVPAVRDDEEH